MNCMAISCQWAHCGHLRAQPCGTGSRTGMSIFSNLAKCAHIFIGSKEVGHFGKLISIGHSQNRNFQPGRIVSRNSAATRGGFHCIRYYGFICNHHLKEKLQHCRELLAMAPPSESSPAPATSEDYRDRYERLTSAFSPRRKKWQDFPPACIASRGADTRLGLKDPSGSPCAERFPKKIGERWFGYLPTPWSGSWEKAPTYAPKKWGAIADGIFINEAFFWGGNQWVFNYRPGESRSCRSRIF
jgi:hypothetical protein